MEATTWEDSSKKLESVIDKGFMQKLREGNDFWSHLEVE